MTKVRTEPDTTGLEHLEPASHTARDAGAFRRIVAAQRAVTEADRQLHEAVRSARQAGESWTVIGAALDVSRQAAQKRFGRTR